MGLLAEGERVALSVSQKLAWEHTRAIISKSLKARSMNLHGGKNKIKMLLLIILKINK